MDCRFNNCELITITGRFEVSNNFLTLCFLLPFNTNVFNTNLIEYRKFDKLILLFEK